MVGAITFLRVCVKSASSRSGLLLCGHRAFPCLLGRNGLTYRKREGDGKTPVGMFRMLSLAYHPDRGLRPRSGLPCAAIRANEGWCDAPDHPVYNRKIRLPFSASHEALRRSDSAYDTLVILDFNMHPRKRGGGSAIFFHIGSPASQFTQGCIAVGKRDMQKLLEVCGPRTTIMVAPAPLRRKSRSRPGHA
jgi:L,D-peptidoglycan transpeptidase YkuD (ErfK/YbiS/YcfS/YnhG family)